MWAREGSKTQIFVDYLGSDPPGKNKNVIDLLLSTRWVQEGEGRAVPSRPGVFKGITLIITAFTRHALPNLCREVHWGHGGSIQR